MMMPRIHKYRLPVRIDFIGELNSSMGVVYVRQDQRVIDMLCDQRSFFPVETTEGLLIVGKAAVARILVVDRKKVEENPELFPNVDVEALSRRSSIAEELA